MYTSKGVKLVLQLYIYKKHLIAESIIKFSKTVGSTSLVLH